MCGILLKCCSTGCGCDIPPPLVDAIKARGPHSFQNTDLNLFTSERQLSLCFAASVLALRGEDVVPQPLRDDATGSLFCWNGEAWKIGADPITQGNDASAVFHLLLSAISRSGRGEQDTKAHIRAALVSVVGPFSFIFFDLPHKRVFYGRDVLGRRSLVWRTVDGESFFISSVACGTPGVEWKEVDADGVYEIDLVNYKFCGDLYTDFHSWSSLMKSFPPLNRTPRPQIDAVLHADLQLVESLRHVLRASVALRLTGLLVSPSGQTSAAKLAVLFSGGLDCTLLARLAHEVLPQSEPIELLNVAFENPRISSARNIPAGDSSASIYELCPDRITARASHRELLQVCPGRIWDLVTINIPFSETQEHRSQIISLMYPHNTEMDLSIALALYFASRGSGNVMKDEVLTRYKSQAKVLLSGLGADELFGGYGRHLVAFKRGGEPFLAEELELDFQRIAKRNLGRDDRVIAHWGKEVRYPFLDEDLVTWALRQPISNKCDFASVAEDGPDGQLHDPAKGILRSLARHLGMAHVANEKKRAIQFGARTAKMHAGKIKGTHIIQSE